LGGDLPQSGGVLALNGNANVSGNFYQANWTVSIAAGDTLVLAGAAQFSDGNGEVDGPGARPPPAPRRSTRASPRAAG